MALNNYHDIPTGAIEKTHYLSSGDGPLPPLGVPNADVPQNKGDSEISVLWVGSEDLQSV